MPSIITISRTCPQVATGILAITCCRVVISTTGIVTLTDRTHGTTTIDITHHVTTAHVDLCVTKHLTSQDTIDGSVMEIIRIRLYSRAGRGTDILEFHGKLSLTTTTAIEGVTYQTVRQCHMSITHDVAVLATTIDSTSDTVTAAHISRRI